MTTCFEQREIEGLNGEDDDMDLEALIEQSYSGNDESGSCGGGDVNESNESIESVGVESHSSKSGFFDKHFLKSRPVAILSKRIFFGSNSNIACSAPTSSSPRSLPSSPRTPRKAERISSSIQKKVASQMIWNVWISDLAEWKDIELPSSTTCALLLHKLLTKLQRTPDLTQWSIIEQNSDSMIERYVEDYELMDDVLTNQEPEHISRFCLSRTSAKYTILQHPELCLPQGMLTFPANSVDLHDSPDSVKRLHMKRILTETAPELCGWLHVREVGRRPWKRLYCVLRNSGLYYSTKLTNKDPQNLICLAEVHSARVWFPINNKKPQNHPPTAFCFCLKPRSYNHGSVIRWFCAENSQVRSAWISGLRLTMNGNRFHESYLSARRHGPSHLIRSSSDRMINKYDANFVAMDFRGATGRVIHDPREVTMVELEQQSSWRRRLLHRNIHNAGIERNAILGNSAPTREVAYFTKAIHLTQPWFYGKISREAATEEIQRHGSLDGTFLVRDSQTIPGGNVLTLCHNQKSRHIPVTLLERDGQYFYSSDNGETRFLDLIQYIDYHRLNKGSLPCLLLHECIRRFV